MKYFFNLEKKYYTKTCMNSKLLKDGMIMRDQRHIMLEQYTFYKKLITSNPKYSYTYTEPFGPKLTNKERDSIEGPITIEEIVTVLKTCNDKKSLGTDGLPVDWYKVFFSCTKVYLHEAFLEALENGYLHSSARSDIIILIPKKSKNANLLANWRPLTLLNTDFKLISKVLAYKMKKFLNKLINKDQMGFMQGREILQNIKKMLNIIQYAKEKQVKVIILSLDFETCFDKIEHSALHIIFKAFNFGDNFI